MFWPFNRKRRAADAANDVMLADDHAGPVREFPWGVVALWMVKLLLWLLAKEPRLMHVVIEKQRRIAEELPGSDRDLALIACDATERVHLANPQVVAMVLRGNRA